MEISNKTLTILLIGTMLVSAFGTLVSLNRIDNIADFLSLTGAFGGPGATTWGATNITIQSNLEINFSDHEVNFSSGRVASGSSQCSISTEGRNDSGCRSFQVPSGGLILENTGNQNAKVNLTNTNWSSSFFRDNLAGYAIKIQVPEDYVNGQFNQTGPTCAVNNSYINVSLSNPSGTGYGNFTGPMYVNLTSTNYPGSAGTQGAVLCQIFNASDGNDIINISILMHISSTTPATAAGAADMWTATAFAI